MFRISWFIGLILVFLICCDQVPGKKKGLTVEKNQVAEVKNNLPVIKLQKGELYSLESNRFKHSVGGQEIEERTEVSLKYNDRYLEVYFECLDNPRVEQNHYTEDNSALFKQEVFELFIGVGQEAPERYLEIQINPNNALFLGRVTNKFKSDSSFNLDQIDTQTAGVIHEVDKFPEEDRWKGFLRIPLSLINGDEDQVTNYRLNMYRIISQQDQVDKDWSCDVNNSTFACWSSTMSKRPNFHRPQYFGQLILK